MINAMWSALGNIASKTETHDSLISTLHADTATARADRNRARLQQSKAPAVPMRPGAGRPAAEGIAAGGTDAQGDHGTGPNCVFPRNF